MLRANAQTEKELFTQGTIRLAQRLASLALCTESRAYQGKDSSTLDWYNATALSKWNDEILAKLPPSADLKFEKETFEKAYNDEIARRLNLNKNSPELKAYTERFADSLTEFTEDILNRSQKLGESTKSLKLLSAKARQNFSHDSHALYQLSKNHNVACSDLKKGSSYWSDYSYLGIKKKAPQEPTLKKKENLVQRIIPGRSPSDKTESLIDIAYKQTFVYRNKFRVITGKKAADDPLSRCAMYVSIALEKQGCTPEFRAPNAEAKNIGSPLSRLYGFENLMKNGKVPRGINNLYDVPAGAVLVYGGYGAGHVEIRTKRGFISDYYSSNPRTGSTSAGSSAW